MKHNYTGDMISNNIKTLKQSINSGKQPGSESLLESLEVLDPRPYENPPAANSSILSSVYKYENY
jgi:hypothetical protein